MIREELIELLREAGADNERAEQLADQRLRDEQFNTELNKSFEALEAAKDAQERVEAEHSDRLIKAHEVGQQELAELFAPALDQFLSEQRAQNQAQATALGAMVGMIKSQQEELRGLRSSLEAQRSESAEAPRSKAIDYIPAPGEQMAKGSDARADLYAQLEELIKSSPDSAPSAVEAISMLESGADPQAARARAGLV